MFEELLLNYLDGPPPRRGSVWATVWLTNGYYVEGIHTLNSLADPPVIS